MSISQQGTTHKPDKQLWIVNCIDSEIPFTPKVDQFALDSVGLLPEGEMSTK